MKNFKTSAIIILAAALIIFSSCEKSIEPVEQNNKPQPQEPPKYWFYNPDSTIYVMNPSPLDLAAWFNFGTTWDEIKQLNQELGMLYIVRPDSFEAGAYSEAELDSIGQRITQRRNQGITWFTTYVVRARDSLIVEEVMMKYRQAPIVDYAHRLFQSVDRDYPRKWTNVYRWVQLRQYENGASDQQIETFMHEHNLSLVEKETEYRFGGLDWRVRIENKLGPDAFEISRRYFTAGLGYAEPVILGYAPWP